MCVSIQGKSAALGLSIASAIGYGYSNIFVTAPNPENLKTVFEFVFKVSMSPCRFFIDVYNCLSAGL